eukprot:GSChrysophyteH2.ASY1.ANO1.985.1 assembled CDS
MKMTSACGPQKKWLVIDTDAGVDDAVGLCMAALSSAAYGFELKLLMTSHGNTSEDNVFNNCKKCMHGCGAAGANVDIARGATKPTAADTIDASYFHGRDGLGDVCTTAFAYDDAKVAEERAAQAQHALVRLLEQAQAAPTPVDVVLVTLGPLTNLAGLIQCSNGDRDAATQARITVLLSHLAHIVIMGGSANGLGNVTRTAEFNINADAEAAHVVFSYPWSTSQSHGTVVTIVSWDLCKEAAVPWAQLDSLDGLLLALPRRRLDARRHISAECVLPSLRYAPRAAGAAGNKGAVVCDCLAVAVALAHNRDDTGTGALVQDFSDVHVDVELDGTHTRGQTVVDFGHCYDGVSRARYVRWVTQVDVAVYVDMFTRLFDV